MRGCFERDFLFSDARAPESQGTEGRGRRGGREYRRRTFEVLVTVAHAVTPLKLFVISGRRARKSGVPRQSLVLGLWIATDGASLAVAQTPHHHVDSLLLRERVRTCVACCACSAGPVHVLRLLASALGFPQPGLQLLDVLVAALQGLLQVLRVAFILLDFRLQCCDCVSTKSEKIGDWMFKLLC